MFTPDFASNVRVIEQDGEQIVLGMVTGTPPTDANKFRPGAVLIQGDAVAGSTGIYQNTGTAASPTWTLLNTGEDLTLIDDLVVGGDAAVTGVITASTGIKSTAQTLTPDDADGAGVNMITPGVTSVSVGANVNGVNDWITLPSLASVPIGHCITIVSNAAGHEVRTPATSAEEINSEDCDGTKEYAIAAGGEIHRFTKIDDTVGWMGQGFTAIGAVVAAIVPD